MEFGFNCSRIDEAGIAAYAENLGYDFCWVTDSPLIRSNPWVILTLVAQQTRRIRLGTGVAVPGMRLAPVAANGIATINRLAPGRCFIGLGTGNTAMRMIGHPPVRVAAYAEYIRVLRALLDGEEVDFTLDGKTAPIRFQHSNPGYLSIEEEIPIHVGGFGPRAQALAGELGDALITGIPRGGTVPEALANVKKGAAKAGRSLDDFKVYALVNLLMLEPGEPLDSDRVIAQCGSAVMANVHYLVERWKETGDDPPDYVKPIWKEYIAFLEARDASRQHQELHQSHYAYLDPEEARFITPEMVRTFCVAGQPEEIVEQLKELERQGLDGINFLPPLDQKFRMIEELGRKVIARM